VAATEEMKSIGNENTFDEDTDDEKLLMSTLMQLCESVAARAASGGEEGRTITTKIRLEGFVTYTRCHDGGGNPRFCPGNLWRLPGRISSGFPAGGKKVRLHRQ